VTSPAGPCGSDYFWFDAAIVPPEGADRPEFALIDHGFGSEFPFVGSLRIEIGTDGSGWSVRPEWTGASCEAGRVIAQQRELVVEGPLRAAESAYGLVHRALMSEAHTRGYSRIHAALVDIEGTRVAIAGPSGAGKTTLALRLAAGGAVLHSDEGVLLRGGAGIGLPRRVHVKASGIGLVPPDAAARAARLGYTPPIFALDPASLVTVPPVLSERPIDRLVLLGTGSGAGAAHPLSPKDTLWALLDEAAGYASESESLADSRSRLVAEASALISAAPAYRIDGEREGWPALVRELAAR
jgi:hypothetical protein